MAAQNALDETDTLTTFTYAKCFPIPVCMSHALKVPLATLIETGFQHGWVTSNGSRSLRVTFRRSPFNFQFIHRAPKMTHFLVNERIEGRQ